MKANTAMTLTNCRLVTVDADNTYYRSGRVVVENGCIDQVGSADSVAPRGRIVDLGGRILMPGLVNTHTHSPSSLFRGLADDLPLRVWLEEHMWPAEKHLTPALVLAASQLSYLEFLFNGMTTNVDMWYFAESVRQAAEESGLRAFIAPGVFSFPSPESDDSLGRAADFLRRHADGEKDARVQAAIGPHDVYSCTPDILSAVAGLAGRYGVLTTVHLSEAPGDNEEVQAKYGMSPARCLEAAGIFDHPVLCAHCVHLSDADMEILRAHGASVSYNPVSNMKLCDGVLPLRRLREKGVTVSMGVDGAQSNNSLALLPDAKTGALLQKVWTNDPSFCPAESMIRMLTIDGARAVGLGERIGSIEPGKRADLITLDVDFAGFTPLDDRDFGHIASHVLYASPRVNDVFVDGEPLLLDKIPQRVDGAAIVCALRDAAEKLLPSLS